MRENYMDRLLKEYCLFVNGQIINYKNEEQSLKVNERNDESNFYKIRGNVCDIYLTLMNATLKKVEMKSLGQEEKKALFISEYLRTFETVPKNWMTRLEQGKKVGDIEIVAIEEIKYDTMNILKDKFIELTNY
jgi:hypothetical protein